MVLPADRISPGSPEPVATVRQDRLRARSHRLLAPGPGGEAPCLAHCTLHGTAMKVLQVTECYPPSLGGTEHHVQMFSRELVRRGHEVTVATLAVPGAPEHEVDPYGVHVHRLEMAASKVPGSYRTSGPLPHLPAPDPLVVRGLAELVRDGDYAVVCGHNWMSYSYLALPAKRRAPLLWTLHDYGAVCHKRTRLYTPPGYEGAGKSCPGERLSLCVPCGARQYGWPRSAAIASALAASKHILNHRTDRFIAVSRAVADAAAGAVGGTGDIEVVPTFIDDGLGELAASAERPSFLPEGRFVLYVGGLGAYKGLFVALEASRQFYKDAPLVVIGTKKDDTPQSWPDGVIAASNVPHEDVMAAWAACTVGIVPSVWEEPWGQVAAEAMAAGRPVVASDIGGLRGIVQDGRTGVLVPPGDAGALGRAVKSLLDDPARAEAMGRAGAEAAKVLTVSTVTDRLEEILFEMAAGDHMPDS